MTDLALEAALAITDIDPRPLIAFIGAHSDNLDAAMHAVASLSRGVEALYIQPTPLKPLADGPSKLLRIGQFVATAGRDFEVIVGRGGAVGRLMRCFGAAASDAGIAEGETFSFGTVARPRKRSESLAGKGFGRRIYVPAFGRSLSGRDWNQLIAVEALRPFLRCTLPCCRFSTLETTTQRAVEHSLRSRVHEAASHAAAGSPSMRTSDLLRDLQRASSTLQACNSVLVARRLEAIKSVHLDNQIALLARMVAASRAA